MGSLKRALKRGPLKRPFKMERGEESSIGAKVGIQTVAGLPKNTRAKSNWLLLDLGIQDNFHWRDATPKKKWHRATKHGMLPSKERKRGSTLHRPTGIKNPYGLVWFSYQHRHQTKEAQQNTNDRYSRPHH